MQTPRSELGKANGQTPSASIEIFISGNEATAIDDSSAIL